jgi:hypothetical protein
MVLRSTAILNQNVTQNVAKSAITNCENYIYDVTQGLSILLLCQMIVIIYAICLLKTDVPCTHMTMYLITLVYSCISLSLSNCNYNSNTDYQYIYTGICIFLQVLLMRTFCILCNKIRTQQQ